MMTSTISRRAALSGAVASVAMVSAAAAAMPVVTRSAESAAFRAALDASDAARDRFNSLPDDLETADLAQHTRETAAMIAALNHADAAVPTTWQEYTRLIEHMADDGHNSIDEDNAERLLAHARRLAKTEMAA